MESSLRAQPLHLFWQHSSTGVVALVQVASFRQMVYWREMDFAQPAQLDALLLQLEKEMRGNSNLQFSFSKVQCCFDTAYTLVPQPILLHEGPEKFLPKKADEEYVQLNTAVQEACVLFAVNSRLLAFYQNCFQQMTVTHSAALLIGSAGYSTGTASLVVNAAENHLDMVLLSQAGELLLGQRYLFVTDSDFLYHLLLVCDRFQLDREELQLQLSGWVQPEGSLLVLLKEYFRNISLATHSQLRYSTALEQLPAHRHFVLLNSAS